MIHRNEPKPYLPRTGAANFHSGTRWHVDPARRRDQAETDLAYVEAILLMHAQGDLKLLSAEEMRTLWTIRDDAMRVLCKMGEGIQ